LAETYLYGLATPVDIDTALAFYDKAAEAGHIHAQLIVYILNNEYLADESTPEQKWRGLAFLQQSAAAGYEKAQKKLEQANAHPMLIRTRLRRRLTMVLASKGF
jgi:TPR repeat protein